MFDKSRLKDVLVQYKKDFLARQWGKEKYKWEAVKCFQVNWNVNADDFAGMLEKSLAATYNLLTSANNFPKRMISGFAKTAPEEVRAMFIALYDETQDVYTRIKAFKDQSTIFLRDMGMVPRSIFNMKMPSRSIFGSVIRTNIMCINSAR